jgi:hypothetical protein
LVGGTLGGGSWFLTHKLLHDPTIVTHSKTDPFPYLRVQNGDHSKLYTVHQEEEELDEHIDLIDILTDRYDI